MSFGKRLAAPDSVLATLARENGPRLIEQAIKALLAVAVVAEGAAVEERAVVEEDSATKPKVKKPSLGQRLAGAALVRVATRSVPGAIIVSGGLIAKALHDRHKARQAAGIPDKQR